jgi:hypothetical protein
MYVILVVAILLVCIVFWELYSRTLSEGFVSLREVIAQSVPRRYDVTLTDDLSEEPPYMRDRRYFAGYVDVQRLGIANDFCRMVESRTRPGDKFLACALAGTENMDSYAFRTPKVVEGLQMSRDDYMADAGRVGPGSAYCRILKTDQVQVQWQAMCNPVGMNGFQSAMTQDPTAPEPIRRILRFYVGILIWYRFQDDLLDYAKNTTAFASGGAAIDETPARRDTAAATQPLTRGMGFDGDEQFLRIGENSQMQLGFAVPMRTVRAVSFWVRWDQFTNWARVFDFGDGANKNSIYCGIEQRGNPGIDTGGSVLPTADGPMLAAQVNEVCRPPPHAPEVSPQTLFHTSDANIDAYACPLPDAAALAASEAVQNPETAKATAYASETAVVASRPATANLIFEIWDTQQRKMRIRIVDFYVLGRWTHVTITTTSADAQRPSWTVYRDGVAVYTHEGGWLAQTNLTSHNYIGRSTDEDPSAQWADRTERFKGRLYDFRVYQVPMSAALITDTVAWGREALVATT